MFARRSSEVGSNCRRVEIDIGGNFWHYEGVESCFHPSYLLNN